MLSECVTDMFNEGHIPIVLELVIRISTCAIAKPDPKGPAYYR